MRVLDLFSGMRGWSAPWQEAGHEVLTLDVDPKFEADMVVDILEVTRGDFPWVPDVILASPPCEHFSVATIGKNWNKDYTPKHPGAFTALRVVKQTMNLIDEFTVAGTSFFVVENPRAMLRKVPLMNQYERRTVTYCRYGEKYMKPTDLWGGFPPSLKLRDPCRGGYEKDGCHERAPRGSRLGVQGLKNPALRALIPRQLSEEIMNACLRDRGAKAVQLRDNTLFG